MKKFCLLGIAMMAMSISLASGSEKKEMTRLEEPVVQNPVVKKSTTQKSTTQKSTTQKSTTQKSTTQKSTLNPDIVKRVKKEAIQHGEIAADCIYKGYLYESEWSENCKSDYIRCFGAPRTEKDKEYYALFKKVYKETITATLKVLNEM